MIIRYADDIVVGFQHVEDAKCFRADMQARLARFALALHAEKTRLIEFGKYAAERRAGRGRDGRRPSTFLGSPTSVGSEAMADSCCAGTAGATACARRCGTSVMS